MVTEKEIINNAAEYIRGQNKRIRALKKACSALSIAVLAFAAVNVGVIWTKLKSSSF